MILRKIIKIVAKRRQILSSNCTKFDVDKGSAPNPLRINLATGLTVCAFCVNTDVYELHSKCRTVHSATYWNSRCVEN